MTSLIIRNATIVKECLHRFCGSCIDRSLFLGKKEVRRWCGVCGAW